MSILSLHDLHGDCLEAAMAQISGNVSGTGGIGTSLLAVVPD